MKFKLFLIFMFGFVISFENGFSQINNTEKLRKISKNIRCLICQGQSVYESNSQFANNMKELILQKLNNGDSEDEIYLFLKSKYGEWIVYKPEFNYHNFLLWSLPYLIFIISGIYFLYKTLKKRKIL